MTEQTLITKNSIQFTDSNGNSKTIQINIGDGEFSFGDLDIRASQFTAVSSGGSGSTGAIDTISISVAGSGFAANETGSFYNKTGSGSGGTWKIISVNGSGGVTDLEITDGGSGYAVNDVLYINEEAEEGETRPEITVDSIE